MTARYSIICGLLVVLACLGGMARAAVPQGIDAEREEARITRAFSFSSLADAYLTDIVERITAASHRPLVARVRVRTLRLSRPVILYLGNGALFVSSGLLARLESDSQVAALIAPELVEALYAVPSGLAKKKGVTNDSVARVWLRNAGFDESQGPFAIQRLRDLLAAEKQFEYGPWATDTGLKRRNIEMRRALAAPNTKSTPAKRVPDDPDRLRKISHQYSLDIAADFVDRHLYDSFTVLIERVEREYGADGRSICLRAQHLRSLGNTPAAAVIDAFRQCVSAPDAPVHNYRELAFLYRAASDSPAAIHAFNEYLRRAPTAADAPIIKTYIEELRAKQQ